MKYLIGIAVLGLMLAGLYWLNIPDIALVQRAHSYTDTAHRRHLVDMSNDELTRRFAGEAGRVDWTWSTLYFMGHNSWSVDVKAAITREGTGLPPENILLTFECLDTCRTTQLWTMQIPAIGRGDQPVSYVGYEADEFIRFAEMPEFRDKPLAAVINPWLETRHSPQQNN
jgi:hypothetical protein